MAPKPKPKSKPKPKPTESQPSISIEDLFSSLNRHISSDQLSPAVKLSDQILAISPGDEDAIKCKIVALIRDDNIDDALNTIESSRRFPIDLDFLKAYCLYRKNKLDEALESLKSQERDEATLLLESQILYRLGRFNDCLDIYQGLEKSKIDNLEMNFVAALVAAGRSYEVQKVLDALKVRPTSNYELAYNTACSLVETKKYTDAEQLLLSARRMGQEALMEENFAEDAIENELAPMSVQLAYLQQLIGNTGAALEAYMDIIKKNYDDEQSLAVAINNLVALRGPKDVSDSLKKLDRVVEKGDGGRFQLARGLDIKIFGKHKECIYFNRALLLTHGHRIDQAREQVNALLSTFPDSVSPVLLQAALLVRENKAVAAEEVLGQAAEKYPDKSNIFLLAKAQVAASAGHSQVAADSLAKIPDIQHMPATVATIVALKERAGDIDGADAVFDAAIEWWSNSMSEDDKLSAIMREAASFKVKHGREREAFELFERLVKTHKSIDALVGLVKTAAHVDVDKAEAYEKQLKPLPSLKTIDVDALERTSGAKHAEGGSRLGTVEGNDENKKEKAKKKRKRKPRYPKGFDPANPGPPPDPERWLPKRERSSYRPKRKDKRTAHVRGSQGAVVREVGGSDTSRGSGSANAGSGAGAPNVKSSQTSTSKGASQSTGSSKSRKKSRK